jgi:uncharacterized oligopeptide transporter (OPT) family protein
VGGRSIPADGHPLCHGLLITFPIAGWAVLAGIAIRLLILRFVGESATTPMTITAAGMIAGDALYGFSGIFRS